jgi:subtilase family serine protease
MTPERKIHRAILAGLAAAATVLTAPLTTAGAAAAAPPPAPVRAAFLSSLATGPAGLPSLGSQPPAVPPGHVTPLWRLARGARPGSYPGQHATPDSIGEPGGYDPVELRAYLGLHGTGAGQTVAVTEASDVSLSVTTALAAYDSWYGLPPACSATVTTGCFQLTFAAPANGFCETSICAGYGLSWSLEADLDVELIHALAPRASIVVAEGYDYTVASLMTAIDDAQALHPAVVSNSWGTNESPGEQALDSDCPATGSPCVFASGDSGNYTTCLAENASNVNCDGYPAADPNVLAVGGTTLDLAATGKVRSETAWSGSGGGISAYEPLPAYQHKADPWTSGRGVPDVSFDGDPDSGIAV